MTDYVKNPSRLRIYLKDRRAFYYYVNKAIRKPSIRNLLFKVLRLFVPKGRITSDISKELPILRQDGIVFWDRLVEAQTIKRIHQFLADKPVHDSRDLEKKPLNLASLAIRETMKLRYFDTDIAQSQDLVQLVNQDHIISMVTAYLGCKPTIAIMEAWWTKTGSDPVQVLFQDDMYHRDVEDYKFIKLFVYLTDVAESNGAHCFIKGSHNSSLLTQRMAIPDELASAAFDPHTHVVLTGQAGCGFLEDTWGLHRSLPARTGERLLLSVTYSLTSFNPYSPKTPLAENTYGVDPYINRIYLR